MHSGKNFSLKEVLFWTRRDIYSLLIISTIPTACYELLDWKWLSIPWLPIALLGTAVAFVVGFKNNASYDRMWEARKAWGAIVNGSRSWGIMVKDFVSLKNAPINAGEQVLRQFQIKLITNHFAWLTVLRHQLREARVWEAIYKKHNQEYKDKWFSVHEHKHDMKHDLVNYLSTQELTDVLNKTNKATHIIAMQ